ncbi:MAG: FkbM family methyltransferase [Desulfurococcaceae archaeon]
MTGLCMESRLKTGLYKKAAGLLRTLGARGGYLRISVAFADAPLVFAIPLRYAERALDNLEHVLVDCEYFKAGWARPAGGDAVVDAGAFLGFYAVASSRLAGSRGRVYALEPNPEVAGVAAVNVELNEARNILLYPRALCPHGGFLKLYVGEYPAVTSAYREHVEEFSGVSSVIEARCVRLSSLLRHIGYVGVLKLDIEGLEHEVLREARGELGRVQSIVVEVHEDIVDPGDVEEELKKAGFNAFLVYASSEAPLQSVLYATRMRRRPRASSTPRGP